MSLIVEDGTGKSDAESYASVSFAESYNSERIDDSAWAGATTQQKEIALRNATEWLNAKYSGRWRGSKFSLTQRMAWPRFGAYDDEEILISSVEVPIDLQRATAYLAIRLITDKTLEPDLDTPGVVTESSVSIGPISESVKYMSGVGQAKRYPYAERLVAGLITRSDELERA